MFLKPYDEQVSQQIKQAISAGYVIKEDIEGPYIQITKKGQAQ